MFFLMFPCRLSRSGCMLVASFRVFMYQQTLYDERNEEFIPCLPKGKMNSKHLHDLKNKRARSARL